LPLSGDTVFNAFADCKPVQIPNLTLRLEVNNIFDEELSDLWSLSALTHGV